MVLQNFQTGDVVAFPAFLYYLEYYVYLTNGTEDISQCPRIETRDGRCWKDRDGGRPQIEKTSLPRIEMAISARRELV